jgi:hypothetical protein
MGDEKEKNKDERNSRQNELAGKNAELTFNSQVAVNCNSDFVACEQKRFE